MYVADVLSLMHLSNMLLMSNEELTCRKFVPPLAFINSSNVYPYNLTKPSFTHSKFASRSIIITALSVSRATIESFSSSSDCFNKLFSDIFSCSFALFS